MAGWAGWGAGPAGAGSAGGPSRGFLVLLLAVSALASFALLAGRHWVEGAVAAGASVYFALRATGRLGGRGGRP